MPALQPPAATFGTGTTFRAVQRRLSAIRPAVGADAGDVRPLEVYVSVDEPPELATAVLLEPGSMRAQPVTRDPRPDFAAFLDGIQQSRVLFHAAGFPVVYAHVAAVIRERVERRLRTFVHEDEGVVCAPRALLPADVIRDLDALGVEVADTSAPRDDTPLAAHPLALRNAAVNIARHRRGRLEHRLAERWCAERTDPLLVDGGISDSQVLAGAHQVVGVVKSHRILYAREEALQVVLHLRQGERSSVFRIEPRRRTPVASWYLRLRDPERHDPLWGLVRVEVSENSFGGAGNLPERADVVSSWILAESAPLSLPDSRWDAMVYGVRDCEVFLKAVTA